MKKFILVMVFVLLTALFVAFNYLLWDRESKIAELKNLEFEQAGHNVDLNARKREIGALEHEVSSLNDQIDQLEMENSRLNEEKGELNADWVKTRDTLQERIDFINILKQYADIDVLSEPVVKWVEAINRGDYDEAYGLEYEGVAAQERSIGLIAYVEEMKKSISRIDIVEVKLDKLRGMGTGDIYLDVTLDVKLAEEAEQQTPRFVKGNNEVYVKIDYFFSKKGFVISGINNM